ncbi:hypothetical protein M0R45_004302 [Rubus argutus]|uniref:Cdc23 domain-containing protein n=1 Tax=Rubus argutus TaxID=59490 RepID=A0AAW1YJE2_RUBAR
MNLKDNYKIELRAAICQLSDCCLYAASKWAGEQLVGIEHDPAKFTPANTRFQRGSSSICHRFRTSDIISTPIAGVSYVSTPIMEEDEIVDGDFYLLTNSATKKKESCFCDYESRQRNRGGEKREGE